MTKLCQTPGDRLYKCLKLETTNATSLTKATYSQLLQANRARIALGGAYIHQEQCNLIPQGLDVTKDGFHRQCYQKFTNAVSVVTLEGVLTGKHPDERKRPGRSGGFSSTLFLDKCMICGSEGVKNVKGQKQNIKAIQKNIGMREYSNFSQFKKR